MHGWRARLGLLVPATNTTMEPELSRLAPRGVTVHTARMDWTREETVESLLSQDAHTRRAAQQIACVEPDVVVYGCTSGSFVGGPSWNASIQETLTQICHCPTVTTMGAMVAAAQKLGLGHVDVVTPYVEETNERLVRYLTESSIEVLSLSTFDMSDVYEHANIEPSAIYRLAKKNATPPADGVFIACTQLRALEIIDVLERDLHKPVVTANQATFWQAMMALNIGSPVSGFGILLAGKVAEAKAHLENTVPNCP